SAAGRAGGDQAAGFLGQMDEDGAGLRQGEVAVGQQGELVERAEGRELRPLGLAGGMVPAADRIGQPHLLQRPLDAQVAGLAMDGGMDAAEGVESEHGGTFASFSRWEKVANRSPPRSRRRMG